MIGKILVQEIKKRRISIRKAAREIGVAHTTIQRAIEGQSVDLKTYTAIARWLHTRTAELLNLSEDQSVKNQVIYLLDSNPKLEILLSRLIKNDGLLSEEDLFDILAYANYKIVNKTPKNFQ